VLCRLPYGGSASSWGFAIYRASHDDHQNSFYPAATAQPSVGRDAEVLDVGRLGVAGSGGPESALAEVATAAPGGDGAHPAGGVGRDDLLAGPDTVQTAGVAAQPKGLDSTGEQALIGRGDADGAAFDPAVAAVVLDRGDGGPVGVRAADGLPLTSGRAGRDLDRGSASGQPSGLSSRGIRSRI